MIVPLRQALLTAAAAFVLAACSNGADEAPPSASATIGAAGGTLNGPDGVQLVVPAGALSRDTTLSITRVPTSTQALPDGYTAATPMYEFTPHGQVFALPVTLRMPFVPPAGADHADVFMTQPGQPWEATAATVAGGRAEWQRSTLSLGAGLGCRVLGGTDPYRCTQAQLSAAVSATPTTALVTSPLFAGIVHTLTAEATVRFGLDYVAAPDCADPRLRITRLGVGTPLLDQPATLTPDPARPERATGSTVFELPLGYADNGGVTLAFSFTCTRPVNRQVATAHHHITVSVPQPPAGVPPVVLTQPADQSVTAPDTATFTAAASGTPAPVWQWQRSGDGGTTWADIGGATTASYTTPATTVADDGLLLRALAINPSGSVSTASARLTVRAAVTGPAPFLGDWPAVATLDATNPTVGGLIREIQLACSRNGSCMAAWARISSSNQADDGVYAARYTTGAGWGSPLQLASDRGRQPALGVDDDGNAVVVWNARDGAGVPQAWVRRFAAASGWGATAQLSPPGSDRAELTTTVAMNGTGQLTVAYVRRLDAEGSSSLWAARPSGTGWTSVRVPGAGSAFNALRGVTDRLGRTTLAWRGADNAAMAASAAADGSWSTAVDLSGARASSRPPRLGVDADGQAFVVWLGGAANPELHLRRRPTGAAWEPAQVLTFPAGTPLDHVELAAGPAGSASVVFLQGAGNIVLRGFTAAGGWSSTDTVVADGTALDSDLPQVVVDTGGNTTVLWRGFVNGGFNLYARSFAPGLGWRPLLGAAPVLLATIEQTYRETALATLGDGRAAMLFARTNPDFFDVLLGAVQTP